MTSLDLILHAGPMVRAIMAVLLGMSLICWAIIVAKFLELRNVNRESEAFADMVRQSRNMEPLLEQCQEMRHGHLVHVFRAGLAELHRVRAFFAQTGRKEPADYAELLLENVDRAVRSGIIAKRKRLQRRLPFLATTGGVAPFIGLFGTVWGIMTSFHSIGIKGSANLAVVAPGISEALVATAIGLAAAIPAVAAYNHFSDRITLIEDEMLQFSSDLLNRLRTDLMDRPAPDEVAIRAAGRR